MITPPDYELAEKQARLENAEKLRANLNAPDVMHKIQNWAVRYGLEPEFVRFKVLTDDTFALHFVKDPAKQSIHQKIAATHIKNKVPYVEDFDTPPSGGANAKYVVRGLVVEGSTLHAATNDHGKSIDFAWSYSQNGKVLRAFATHKYTRDEGGAQDNQFSDVKRFLREAQACRDPNTLFLAICDGSYYQRAHDGRPSRLQALAEDFPGQRNAVCSLADLPNIWVAAVKVWQGQLA